MAVADEALLVAPGLRQRLAEGDADIFNGVMGVDVQVALRFDFEVEHAVAGDLIEHVIEKSDAGGKLRLARAVKIDFDPNTGFEGVTVHFGAAHGVGVRVETNGMIPFRACCNRYPTEPTVVHTATMSRYWSTVVKGLTPYVPGEQPKLANLVKLNTNENPYGPSPRVLEALRIELGERGDNLRLYPDPNADRLKAAVASFFGNIEPRQVFVGNGSDEVLGHVFLALLKHERPILFPDITYSFYPVYCGLYDIEYQAVPLDDAFAIRVADYARPRGEIGGIVFPNPNAPTGRGLPLADIARLLAANPDSVVVIDEAYIDFGGPGFDSAIALVNQHPNLLVVQTLSKSRSLAGLRVGFAVGHPDLIEALERVKNSFNSYPLDRLAIAGAVAALEDREWFERTRQAVIRSRVKLVADLAALGFEVLPSQANFVFARHPRHDAEKSALALRQRSIIVRHFRLPRIDQFLRITIGTDAQCETLVTALREILG